jgi:hypothetical protein
VRTQQVMNNCEDDLNLIQGWFSGVDFQFSFPINVQIANVSGGASWNDPPKSTPVVRNSASAVLKIWRVLPRANRSRPLHGAKLADR